MGKKKEEVPVKVKKKGNVPKNSVLKVSKSIKVMAALASLRGVNKRGLIRMLGEAEDNFKKNGRLILD